MQRLIVLAVALAAACVVVSTAGAVTAPPTTYSDPGGDAGTAPDITGVSATNDDHGLYTVAVTFATPYAPTASLVIFLDTDQNSDTGNKFGADYLFADDHGSHSFDLYSWSNANWNEAPHTTADVVIAPDNMSATFTVNKSELGNVAAFDFFALSLDGDGSAGHFDDAPSGSGWFTYDYQTVFTLSAGSAHDGAAKAGGTWTVSMRAVRSDTNATVGSEATIACKATEGSKKLAVVSHAFVSAGGGGGSTAVCTFRVPKRPKHAAVHATVTVTDAGQSASKAFTAKTK
jgi:hypothetical protein